MSAPKRKKILRSVYLEPTQAKALDALSARTRVPFAVYVREGVDAVIARYARELKSARKGES